MSYSRRIQIAAILSVLLHVTGVVVVHFVSNSSPRPVSLVDPAPIEIDLQPEEAAPREPKQLVDISIPASEPVPPSPLIAEDFSEAMDESPQHSDVPSPELTPDEFDQLAALPSPAARPEPIPTPPTEEKADADTPNKDAEPSDTAENVETESAIEDMDDPLEEVLTPTKKKPDTAHAEESPIKIAQLDPRLSQRPSPGTSQIQDGATRQGATNFQAIQSEIAPYMKTVREQVERKWKEMIYTRYSGTSPVKAVIDCAISPSGTLVSVSVAGTQNDRIYSLLCKDAVQRAGPFGPFPFVVPDIYRDKNLEIRWTFNFLWRDGDASANPNSR